jgi:endoglucanase
MYQLCRSNYTIDVMRKFYYNKLMASILSALYADPNNHAAQTAMTATDPVMKRVMTKLAAIPTANWIQNVETGVQNVVTAAANAGQTPVLVLYNIPDRDLGSYSAGGSSDSNGYKAWIQNVAAGVGSQNAIVILEPDALAQMNQLAKARQEIRYELLRFAIQTLKANPHVKVYVDGGHPNWVNAIDMAHRLVQAGLSDADGFSLNVSNFVTTSDNEAYGKKISALVGNKHFVIDTSRNGNGPRGDEWCNPPGRALGLKPTADTDNDLVDYYLWIKVPGESDGTCNGGPAAGTWWPSYAESLALSAGW